MEREIECIVIVNYMPISEGKGRPELGHKCDTTAEYIYREHRIRVGERIKSVMIVVWY